MIYSEAPALTVVSALAEHEEAPLTELTSALINALLRIDTLERQIKTLTQDLAKVALSKRKYVSDGNSNKE